jgi:glycosyltransferase involved in cell wall biosynthesis
LVTLKRLSVCVLGARGIPGVPGGVEGHCEQLLPRLAALDPSVQFTLLARQGYVAVRRFTHKAVEVVALPAPRHRYFEAFVHTFIGVLYARFGLDARLIHFHAVGPALLAPLAIVLGLKVIVTHHSKNYLHVKWNAFARAALRFGERCAATFSDAVIAVSPSMAEELRSRFPHRAHKIYYVPNGATEFEPDPSNGDSAAALARFGVEPGRYVLAVGRLVPEKGFHELIAAYQKAGIKEKLIIVGRADHEDGYSRKLQSAASDKIVFAGFVKHASLYPLYKHASLFVLPSHHEGMPLSALEAASLGAPILLSDIPASLDLALPQQNYFPVGDVEALAQKLRADHAAYRVGADAFIRQFRWDEVTAATARVYAKVLTGRFEGAVTPPAASLSADEGWRAHAQPSPQARAR